MIGTEVPQNEDKPQNRMMTGAHRSDSPTQSPDSKGGNRNEQEKKAKARKEKGEAEREPTVPLLSRILLSCELLGGEAALIFSQLYVFPDLQTLGMPLNLVSLTGLISGPLAILVLPIMGWFNDSGTNVTRRRAIMVIFSTLILASGAVVIIIANLVYTNVCQTEKGTTISSLRNAVTSSFYVEHPPQNSTGLNFTLLQNSTDFVSSFPLTLTPNQTTSSNTSVTEWHPGCLKIVPGLAMLGFVLIELGYDLGMLAIKTWMLNCSPPTGAGAADALVAGLVMTSLGGMLTAGLGMLDLASLLGLFSANKSTLFTRVSVQVLVVVIFLVAAMNISLQIGYRLRKQLKLKGRLKADPPSKECTLDCNNHSQDSDKQGKCESLATQSNILTKSRFHVESDSISKATASCFHEGEVEQSTSFVEDTPGRQSNPHASTTEMEASAELGKVSVSYKTMGNTRHRQETETLSRKAVLPDDLAGSRDLLLTEDSDEDLCLCQRRWSFKASIGILWVSAYFSVGAIHITTLTISDFVGKAIFGGDPYAPPGSDAFNKYHNGLRIVSYGVLVYYGSYLAFSFLQKRVLSIMGYTVEFVTMTLMLGVCLVALAVTEHVAVFFLLSVMAGIQKATFHVVPMCVVNDLIHAENKRRGDTTGMQIGTAVSLLVGALPAAYCSLYPWIGAVLNATGVLATPLLLSTVYCLLSCAFFFILGLQGP